MSEEGLEFHRRALDRFYWFYKMVANGGPDGSDLDEEVQQEAAEAARWYETVRITSEEMGTLEQMSEPEWDAFNQSICRHLSADGIDQTPLSDPEKIWRCVTCGWEFRSVPDPERPWLVRLVAAHEGGPIDAER